jgi:hypothetical protein
MAVELRSESALSNNETQNEDECGDDCEECDFAVGEEHEATLALDVAIVSVLRNKKLKGDLKWFQYYKALECYLYKQDPTFSPLQFSFDIEEDRSSGERVYVIRPGNKKTKKKPLAVRLLKYAPSIVGPLLGAALTALLRS